MLNVLPIDRGGQKARSAAYHTIIVDRSGSMYGNIKQAVNDAAARVGLIQTGDMLRAMWYSSEGGQFGTAWQGVISDKNRDSAKSAILAMGSTIGATCFSEVLTDWARSLAGWDGPRTLVLLTDGYPVVSNIQAETKGIEVALKMATEASRGHTLAGAFVGYGYYDKQRLLSMADTIGGIVVHAANIGKFGEVVGDMVSENLPSHQIDVSRYLDDPMLKSPSPKFFTVTDAGYPATLVPDESGMITTPGDVIVSHPALPQQGTQRYSLAYAAAFVWNQSGRTDIAMDILADLGDVWFFNQAASATTTEEHDRLEAAMIEAVQNKGQFRSGKRSGLTVDPNAFSLFNLIDWLRQSDATFVPTKEFRENYARIGAGQQVADDVVVKFAPDYDAAQASFDDLTFASDRLNLGIQVHIPGTVHIPAEGQALGLPETLPSSIFRNYTIMRDGRLNVSFLPVSLSLAGGAAIENLPGVRVVRTSVDFDADKWQGVVYIDELPVMNRRQSGATKTFKRVAELLVTEQKLKAMQKVFGDLHSANRDSLRKVAFASIYGNAAADWLASQGVTDGGFSPKSTSVKIGDTYPAKVITFSLAGFSSLPKVSEVRDLLTQNKAVSTPSKKMLADAIKTVDQSLTAVPEVLRPQWVAGELKNIRRRLSQIREEMTAAKFGIAFGGRWFSDFATRNENTLLTDIPGVGQVSATVTVAEKQIAY